MLDIMLGIMLLITFVGLIVYCAKGGNLMVGFFIMTILWVLIGKIPYMYAVNEIFEKTIENYGANIMVIIFGSWFGRVLVDTGIAGSIIRKTVELGGDKPILTIILLSLMTTLIFTSVYGVGAIMAIGVIILPILFSMGIPQRIAVSSYVMSVGAGMYINIAQVKQLQVFFPIAFDNAYIKLAFILIGVHVAVNMLFILFSLKKNNLSHAWAAPIVEPTVKNLPSIVFLIPIIPIFLIVGLKWQPIPSFILTIILALLLTKNLKSYQDALTIIQKTFHAGVADVGLLIGMMLSITAFGAAATKASPILGPIIQSAIPANSGVLALAFGLLAPLALFRGPMMMFGSGGATVAILSSLNIFRPEFLFNLFMIPLAGMVFNTCPTQSWNMWALNYAKITPKEFVKTGLAWSWILVFINQMIAYYFIR